MAVSNMEFRERFPYLVTHIDDSSVSSLISVADERTFSVGDIVIRDNTLSDKLFFMLEGSLNSFIEKDGEIINLGEINPGEIAGEISMFGECPTTATVIAKTDCRLLTLDKVNLNRLQDSAPEFVSQLLRVIFKTLANRLIISDKLLYQHLSGEGEQSEEYRNIPALVAWCTKVYQCMHGRQEL